MRKVATQVGRATSKGKRGAAGAAGDAPKYAAARTGGTRGSGMKEKKGAVNSTAAVLAPSQSGRCGLPLPHAHPLA